MNSSTPGFAPSSSPEFGSRAKPFASTSLQDAPASARQVLRALFELAQADQPADAGSVARRLGLRASDVAQHLVRLDALGFVRAERARLTLLGLAAAARLDALPPARTAERGAAQERRADEGRSEHQDVPLMRRQVSLADGAHRVDPEFCSPAEAPASTARTIRTGPSSVSL
jgi:hypothetical protein